MSQSIRSCSGLVPILQHINPNNTSSSSCMEVGFFPISSNLSSVKECRKRAWISVVSNRNHNHNHNHPRFLPCAATMKSSSNVDEDDDDEGDTSTSKGRHDDDPPKAWRTILSNYRSAFGPPQVTKRGVVLIIRMDLHDPIDGLKVLLDASRAWRMILSLTVKSVKSYDAKEFDDSYGESYLRKARMKGGTNKGKHNKVVKNPPSRTTTRLSIIRLLADLNDPNDGLEVLLGALDLWRTVFSSNELNDSEGYLQKEIFAIRNLSHLIWVSNRNGKNDAVSSQLTHLLALFKLMIDNFEDPDDALKAMSAAFRCLNEGVECDATSGLLVAAVAKLKFNN